MAEQTPSPAGTDPPEPDQDARRIGLAALLRPELVFLLVAALFAGGAWTWRAMQEREPPEIEFTAPESLGTKVAVNRLDVAGLTVIPGVGEKLAENMVKEREASGPFRDADDLLARVKGLRRERIESFKQFLSFE